MSKQFVRKPLSLAVGAVVLAVAGMANAGEIIADTDLFTMEQLDSAQLIASETEGSCGEGKCGEDKDDGDSGGEGSCGGDKGGEGSCGGAT